MKKKINIFTSLTMKFTRGGEGRETSIKIRVSRYATTYTMSITSDIGQSVNKTVYHIVEKQQN